MHSPSNSEPGASMAMLRGWDHRGLQALSRYTLLEHNVHAHLFRHGYAVNFLNCSGRIGALQEQLGYRDIDTTRIYLRLSDDDLRREVSKIQF